ncbi:SAP domain-containing protein [Desulfopila sp. IMCC35006]|uniref:SAP domain-containing protein n=1 Tax=Desulfopila sp. IMCC35006 TaxID=2569542 RepID=UPI0010AD6D7E|nr:SAP domain-containing protein [Desulfopila sp. IMCC35006]TKB26558.1 SAP domain-containing protein [Desulfopila sp. IMCC35006]
MKLIEVQEKARQMGIKPRKIKKADLIRIIQTGEGNQPCFRMGDKFCDQMDCCWRDDCLT